MSKQWQEQTAFRDRFRDVTTRVLVDVNRWLIVGFLAAAVFIATILVGLLGPITARQFLLEGTPAAEAYVELQTATITIIAIVLTINQLVLSPELGAVSNQRQRLDDTMSHRIDVEDVTNEVVSPREPAQFLRSIVEASRERASNLTEVTANTDDPELRHSIREYREESTEEAERVSEALAEEGFGTIRMLGIAMHLDTPRSLYRIHRIRNQYESDLSTVQRKAIDDMIDVLELYTITQEYFKTLYVRWQFIRFSRALLYTGLPALLVAHYTVQIIGEDMLPGTTLGIPNLLLFEGMAFTITLLPVLVLISFIARLVTLSETSIFISPFIPTRKE
jgi:hypothetical protein